MSPQHRARPGRVLADIARGRRALTPGFGL